MNTIANTEFKNKAGTKVDKVVLVKSDNAATIAADLVASDQMQKQWTIQHRSRADENPAHKRAAEIKDFVSGRIDWKSALAENPKHLKFLQEFIAVQRGAMHSRVIPAQFLPYNNDEDLKTAKEGLDIMASELESIIPETELPRLKDLPRDMQELLKIEKFHTAQKPFQPVRGSAQYLWDFLKHLKHEIIEHRATVAPSAVIMGYITYLMLSNFGLSSTKLSQDDVTMDVCSIEDALAGRTGDACLSTNQVALPEVFQNCHSHIKPLVFNNDTAAQFLVDIGAAKILGPDCSTVSTLAEDTREAISLGYKANLNRHQETIGDPVGEALRAIESIGLSSAKDPEIAQQIFRETLDHQIDKTVQGINAYDVYENFILHGGIVFLVGALVASAIAKGKVPTAKGMKNTATRLGNLFNRLGRNCPLTVTAATAGAAYPAITNYGWQEDVFTGNLNPDVVLMGLGAGLTGAAIEKTVRYMKRSNHIRNMTVDVKDKLADLTNKHRYEVIAPKIKHKASLMKPTLAAGFSAVAGYALVNLDFMFTNGQITAQTIGTGTPIGLFLASNPITDVVAHKGFAIAGAVIGGSVGLVARTAYVVGKKIMNPTQKVSFFNGVAEDIGHHHDDDDHDHHDHDDHDHHNH